MNKVIDFINKNYNKNKDFDIAITNNTIYLLFKDTHVMFAKFYVESIERYMEVKNEI